jgi:hypothetical protein
MSACVCRSYSGPARAEHPRSGVSHKSGTPTLWGINVGLRLSFILRSCESGTTALYGIPRERNTHAPGHQCRLAFVVHPQVLRQRDDRTLWHPPRAEHPRSGASMSVCVCRSSSGPARAERPRSMASHTSRTPTLRGIPHEQNAHAPGRKEESTFLTPHFSPLTPHPSLLTPHSSLLTPRFSPLTPHSSPLTPHSSLLTPHSSLLTPHSSLLTPHSSKLI